MTETLSSTEAKHLLQLCKTGRLFDVQNWIASGKPLRIPNELKTTPLELALDTGFHSLVELLLRNESSQDLKNRALYRAVSHKRFDFIELLISHGAEINSVPFIAVLRVWEPTIIRYFIDHGADVVAESPFAVAFGEKIRTALRPWRECREKYPNLAPQLQEQADRALRHFCFHGDLKWVSLLMWAGADPRTSGITMDDHEDPNDPDDRITALRAATYADDVRVLKRLKPDTKLDDIDDLLSSTSGRRTDVVRYLLELGAKPNDKTTGGSTALERCLESFSYAGFRSRFSSSWYGSSKASKYSVSNELDTLKLLLEHGALWKPDSGHELARMRRGLFECEAEVTFEVVAQLMKHRACSEDAIRDLLRTPTMKKHLSPLARRFVSLGFDVRTAEQKAEDDRQKEAYRLWTLRDLADRYNRGKIYEEIWSEPIQHVAKRYNISDVGLAKVCRKLNIPRPGRGYWAIKAAGKALPKRPHLPKLPL